MGNLIHRFLPGQTDIDKNLHIIQRKVLKGIHLPVEIKEIQVGYLHSPYLKEIFQIDHKEIRSIIRKICFIRFLVVQDLPRKGDNNFGNTRNMCR